MSKPASHLANLQTKLAVGTITQDEFVELLRETEGEDEAIVRRMYRTSYAQKQQRGVPYQFII